MSRSAFVYVAYIRTTPEKLWSALTDDAEFMKQYWFGNHCESQWTAGASWKNVAADGQILDAGEIVEAEPPRRLVIRWQNLMRAELTAEGYSLCTMELEPGQGEVKLSITHTIECEPSKFIAAVSGGWPKVVSNLKSLLEAGNREDTAQIVFGNHSSVLVPRQDRYSIRRFYCDVLGGEVTRADPDRDFVRIGGDFYVVFLYGEVPDESEFLRTARSVWLELKSGDVPAMRQKILDSGLVRKLELPDPHLYFQAPGGQCLRLVGTDEDLSFYEGKIEGPDMGGIKQALGEMSTRA